MAAKPVHPIIDTTLTTLALAGFCAFLLELVLLAH